MDISHNNNVQNLEIFINIVTLHNQKLKLKNKSYYGKRIL